MATKLINYEQLANYDTLIKGYIGTEDAKSFKAITYNDANRMVSFYKTEDTTSAAAFTLTLPSDVDITGKADKVASATAGNFAGLDEAGNLTDSGKKAADFATASDMATAKASIEQLMGEGAGSVSKSIADAIDGLDGNITGDGKFITNLSQVDGVVSATKVNLEAGDIPTITLEKISDAGTAAAANVATTAIAEKSEDTGLVTAAQVAKFVADEVADLEGATHFIGKKDALPETAKDGDICIVGVKEYIWSNGSWEELGDETIYVTKTTTIAGVDLENDITKDEMLTALNVADGAQVNVIETVKVNGTELSVADKAVNVTVATGAANGTIAVNGSDVAVAGLGSAAYTDASAYATAAQGTTADSALQPEDIVTGTTNGTISVDGTEVPVAGLAGAAYKSADYYMVAADYEMADATDINKLFEA